MTHWSALRIRDLIFGEIFEELINELKTRISVECIGDARIICSVQKPLKFFHYRELVNRTSVCRKKDSETMFPNLSNCLTPV